MSDLEEVGKIRRAESFNAWQWQQQHQLPTEKATQEDFK
jgi:hypothetical protein